MTIKDGGTAFPCDRITSGANSLTSSTGMSLRDHFAGLAMQGDIASMQPHEDPKQAASHIANRAYAVADAMIRAREVTA